LNPFQWDFLFVEPIANNTHADGSWVWGFLSGNNAFRVQ
jgi:hypothetical protein